MKRTEKSQDLAKNAEIEPRLNLLNKEGRKDFANKYFLNIYQDKFAAFPKFSETLITAKNQRNLSQNLLIL